mmetsp:Transcript_15952/g.55463  ORF Transcript_15952/g.55463 Transcript_15952/m.55463 type:complete len:300 (+) Transcript_15952:75-974(+)
MGALYVELPPDLLPDRPGVRRGLAGLEASVAHRLAGVGARLRESAAFAKLCKEQRDATRLMLEEARAVLAQLTGQAAGAEEEAGRTEGLAVSSLSPPPPLPEPKMLSEAAVLSSPRPPPPPPPLEATKLSEAPALAPPTPAPVSALAVSAVAPLPSPAPAQVPALAAAPVQAGPKAPPVELLSARQRLQQEENVWNSRACGTASQPPQPSLVAEPRGAPLGVAGSPRYGGPAPPQPSVLGAAWQAPSSGAAAAPAASAWPPSVPGGWLHAPATGGSEPPPPPPLPPEPAKKSSNKIRQM